MRIFVAMLVLAIGSGAAADKADAPAVRWARTDLTLELSKTFINNSACDSSLIYFESCLAAIKAANAYVKDPVSVVANGLDFEKTLAAIADALPALIPVQLMLGDAINAHLSTFDAHAYLAPADAFEPRDNYTGLGMFVRKLARGFLVTEVIEGSAAAAAKMEFGDLITGIPGVTPEDFAALSVNDLALRLRGLSGTRATIQFERAGVSTSVTMTRKMVNASSVYGSRLKSDPATGVVRIREFVAGQTCQAFRKVLDDLETSGVKKLILDLRGNGGGSTQDALCVAGEFLGYQEIVGLRRVDVAIPEKDLIPVYGHSQDILWMRGNSFVPRQIALVVLVDPHTASAAEVVAGSLQSYERAWLVGERTWGKGTQQTFADFPGHPSMIIAATTDRIFMPNMKSHQRVGLTPSFAVDVSATALANEDLEPESEATLFPDGLPAVNEGWTDTRTEREAAIRACVAQEHLDLKILGQLGPASGDYQKAYAAAVLKCDAP